MHHMKLITAAVLMTVGSAAFAADKPPVTANVSMTSNYVWRGISQTGKQMAIQGGFDYEHASGVYVGIWGSNVNFGNDAPGTGDGAHIETDVYGGYKFKAAGIDLDVGVLQYLYPGSASSLKYNFTELYVGATVGPVTAKYSFTSDYQGTTKEGASYLDLGISKEISGVTLEAHVGKSFGDGIVVTYAGYGGDEYLDYKLAASKEFSGYKVTLAWTSTNFTTKSPTGDLFDAGSMVFISVGKKL